MALVAYASSDGDTSSESDDEVTSKNEFKSRKTTNSITEISVQPDPLLCLESSANIELFKQLPAPKAYSSESLKESEDIMIGPIQQGSKPTVKIVLPCLSQFADDEDDQPKKKKIKPSATSSGLLGMLPQPSNLSLKTVSRSLTPYVLSKKAPVKPPIKKSVQKTIMNAKKVADTSLSDDEDEGPLTDFFSLDEKVILPPSTPIPTKTMLKMPAPAFTNNQIQVAPSLPSQNYLSAQQIFATNNLIGTNTSVDSYQEEVASSSQCNATDEIPSEENMKNDDRFLRMTGKKMKDKEEINFIDIHETDQMPDKKEWLKQLSTQPTHQPTHKKGALPNATQRRKHQITYLAFQAKEREQELKNQWAMNRVTRQQTQAKYGF